MKKFLLLIATLLMGFQAYAAYQLVWSDEFNSDLLNTTAWSYEIGTGFQGWGNWEKQYYTNSANNIYVSNGSLVIKALKDATAYDPAYQTAFTSARINSLGKVQAKYGKFEARIKLPEPAKGVWPAFWMMGTNGQVWPRCAEFDIMEYMCNSSNYNTINSTLHWYDESAGVDKGVNYGLATTVNNPTDWHVYTMEWTPTIIKTYIDGVEFYAADITPSHMTEFHNEAYILLNMAIGGTYVNNEYDPSITEKTMEVDYVRIYQDRDAYPASTLTDHSISSSNIPYMVCSDVEGSIDAPGASVAFTLTGKNLPLDVTVSSSNADFVVSPTLIKPVDGAVNQEVTVTYMGTESASTTVTVACGPLSTSVSLNAFIRQDDACNVLPMLTTGVHYFAPGWSQQDAYTASVQDNTISIETTAATYERWQAQFKYELNTPLEINAGTTYEFSFTIQSNITTQNKVLVKLMQDDNNFFCSEEFNLEAGVPYNFVVTNTSANLNLSTLLIDCGGNEAFTINIYDIRFAEQGCTSTGVSDIEKEVEVTLAPNPTPGVLLVSASQNIQQVTVYNLLGKVVADQVVNAADHLKINLSNQVSGVYVVRLVTENGKVIIRRVIKQ